MMQFGAGQQKEKKVLTGNKDAFIDQAFRLNSGLRILPYLGENFSREICARQICAYP